MKLDVLLLLNELQNAGDPAYIGMSDNLDKSVAYQAVSQATMQSMSNARAFRRHTTTISINVKTATSSSRFWGVAL